jgi:hypothetical protein
MSGETLYIPAATQQSAAFPRESVRAAADDHRIVPYDAGSRFAYRDDSDLGPNAVAARRNAVSADGIRQRIAGCASAREQRLMKCECREGAARCAGMILGICTHRALAELLRGLSSDANKIAARVFPRVAARSRFVEFDCGARKMRRSEDNCPVVTVAQHRVKRAASARLHARGELVRSSIFSDWKQSDKHTTIRHFTQQTGRIATIIRRHHRREIAHRRRIAADRAGNETAKERRSCV